MGRKVVIVMTFAREERKHQKQDKIQEEINNRDILKKIFGDNQNPALPKIVQAGLIDSNITYELARGKIPESEKPYYTLRVTSHRRETDTEDVLMSGVFLTRHDAQSYIDFMKSRSGPPLGI
jgi:hypothetical protein